MLRLLSWNLILGLVVFVSTSVPNDHESAAPKGKIAWELNWADAVKRAQAEKRPIMIHFNMDDEPACANMARDHFRNKKVIELSKKFVCVLGSLGDHKGEKVFKEDGKCGRFGTVTCAEHRLSETMARGTVLESKTVTAPQFVFVTPDLKVMIRRPWDLPSSELIGLMNRALYYYNPALSPDAVDKRATELLERLLSEGKSDNAATRRKALDAIAKRDDPKIIKFLIRQTKPDRDLIKRVEAVTAIGEAANATCLPALLETLKDRSQRLRKVTLMALGKLAMVEAIEPIAKAFGVESSTRNKALCVRTIVTCDGDNKTSRKILNKALKSNKSDVRIHAIRACLEVSVNAKEFSKLIKLAKGDTDVVVRAVACHASTTLALQYRNGSALTTNPKEKAAYMARRKKIATLETKKLKPTLKKVAAKDREEKLRDYAALCLRAIESQDYVDLESDLDEFHDDDELLDPEESKAKKKRKRRR